MSITLVIIGLLVGGILVGRDLIDSAKVRRAASQINQYKSAFNAFKVKYNCLPGDCKNATDFGIATANGNGNGFIEGVRYPATATGSAVAFFGQPFPDLTVDAEVSYVMEELSRSGLVSESLVVHSAAIGNAWFQNTQTLPPLKVGQNSFFYITSFQGSHYLHTIYGRVDATGFGAAGSGLLAAYAASMTPFEAYGLATKLSDGTPYAPGAYAVGLPYSNFKEPPALKSSAAAGQDCVDDTVTPNIFSVTNTNVTCDLLMRMD